MSLGFYISGSLLLGITLLSTGCGHNTPRYKPDEGKISEKKMVVVEHKIAELTNGELVIGNLEPIGKDTGCWLFRKEQLKEPPAIFYVSLSPEDIRMNINGVERQLTPITEPGQITKYKAHPFTVIVEWGPMRRHEGPCGTWETLPHAKVTVTDGEAHTTIPAKGECGCG